MSLIWSDSLFGTGFSAVDKQHKKLFKQINRLLEVSVLGDNPEELREILEFLDGYVVTHFRDEEKLMEKEKCPSRAANKEAHKRFLKELSDLKSEFERSGHTPQFVVNAQGLLVDWLRNHIIHIDTKLRETATASKAASK